MNLSVSLDLPLLEISCEETMQYVIFCDRHLPPSMFSVQKFNTELNWHCNELEKKLSFRWYSGFLGALRLGEIAVSHPAGAALTDLLAQETEAQTLIFHSPQGLGVPRLGSWWESASWLLAVCPQLGFSPSSYKGANPITGRCPQDLTSARSPPKAPPPMGSPEMLEQHKF